MGTDGPVLDVSGLRKSYGSVTALRGIELRVEAGEVVGLLGHNGAGKTTLVSIVAGLRRPDAGTVRVDGIDALRFPVRACRRLGVAPQELGLYPTATVRENLLVFGGLAGLPRRILTGRIDQVAAALGLGALMDRRGHQLSGGEKRRLHTAAALLHNPPLLLLDEPTAGADVQTRAALLEVVTGMAAGGTAICYSTHYLPEVETLGASVAVLDHGRLLARGSQADLVARHARPEAVLAFEGAAPPLGAAVTVTGDGSVVRIASDRPEVAVAEALAGLGEDATRLRRVEIVRPSLESAYLALTGRGYEEDDGARPPAGTAGV